MDVAYIGLGANLGDRETTIRQALAALGSAPGVRVTRVSSLRETEPWGVAEQPTFLNGVAELETDLGPRGLLETLLGVERSLGRVRDGGRWGPRVIDLDLLVHGDEAIDEPGLEVPHPYLSQRRFVLEPLAELAPDLVVPRQGVVSELLDHLDSGR